MLRITPPALAILAAALLGTGAAARAASLPSRIVRAESLPEGVLSPRLRTSVSDVGSRYGSAGETRPLGARLERGIRFRDLLDAQPSEVDRAHAESLRPTDLGVEDALGRTTGEVSVLSSVLEPEISYGLNDRVTLTASLPIHRVAVSASTGFVKTAGGEAYVAAAAAADPTEGERAREELNRFLPRELTRMGYRAVENEAFTAPGDLRLSAPIRLLSRASTGFSLRVEPSLTLPTGRGPDPDRYIDAPTGDGQVDVGAALALERGLPELTPDLSVAGRVGYAAQLPDRPERRVPRSAESSLSPDRESVARDLGDRTSVGASLGWRFGESGWSTGAGYQVLHQAATSYRGSAHGAERYGWLEALEPAQTLHGLTLHVGFSGLPAYGIEPRSRLPFELGLDYTRSIAGRDAERADSVAGELVLYF